MAVPYPKLVVDPNEFLLFLGLAEDSTPQSVNIFNVMRRYLYTAQCMIEQEVNGGWSLGSSTTVDEAHPFPRDDVPLPLRHAIMMLAAHLYENREATIVGDGIREVPFGVREIINAYREWTF